MDDPRRLSPNEARDRGREARRAMGREDRAIASEAIVRRIGGLPALRRAVTVAGYWPTPVEVDLIALWHHLHVSGVAVCLPRVDPGASGSMEFVPWDPLVPMVNSRFAIAEPTGRASQLESLDVVVMPCTAVDHAGTRVGMGAGFYDRALGPITKEDGAERPRPTLVCVAFESQLVRPPDSIERQSWDVPADVVVTESRVLETDLN